MLFPSLKRLPSLLANRSLVARYSQWGSSFSARPPVASEEADYEADRNRSSPAPSRPYRDYQSSPSSYSSGSPSSSSFSATPQQGKEVTHPFPEELDQDYSLPGIEGPGKAFSEEICKSLNEPVPVEDVEIKPDGSLYLPEVRYRRILLRAFGPAGWCLVPRGAHSLSQGVLSREYALLCHGRFVAQARGSAQLSHTGSNPALASESVRSNALMRCCKDLGVASDLWDRSWSDQWKDAYALKKQVGTDSQGRPRFLWQKKD